MFRENIKRVRKSAVALAVIGICESVYGGDALNSQAEGAVQRMLLDDPERINPYYYYTRDASTELVGPYPLDNLSDLPDRHAALCFLGQVSFCEVWGFKASENTVVESVETLTPSGTFTIADVPSNQEGSPPIQPPVEPTQVENAPETLTVESTPVDAGTLERFFQDARSAVERGDSEAAIVALETILLLAPELDNIRLELGVLYGNLAQQGGVFASLGEQYDRVGARERSIYFFEKALESDQIPEEVRVTAQQRLEAIQGDGRGRFQYSGSISAGIQLDSNPRALSEQLRLFDTFVGTVRTVLNGEPIESDTSYSVAHDSFLRYYVSDQSYLHTDVSLSLRQYQEVDILNQEFGSAKVGFVFQPRRQSPTVFKVNPFLSAEANRYDGELFQKSFGGGLGLSFNRGALESKLETTASAVDYEGGNERDGTLSQAILEFTYRYANSGWGISTELSVANNNAEQDSNSYNRTGASVGLSYTLGRGQERLPVRFSATFGTSSTSYEEASVIIDPNTVREDDEQYAEASLDFPLTSKVGLRFYGRVTEKDSNIPNYLYENEQVGVKTTWRF